MGGACPNYRNVFDPETRLMRGRLRGRQVPGAVQPQVGRRLHRGQFVALYVVGIPRRRGLVDLMGGREQFVQMLDSVFVVPPIYDDSYYGFRIHEITEMQVADMGTSPTATSLRST